MTDRYYFVECVACAAKPGSPGLCAPCLHNRSAISNLLEERKVLASAMTKFAPDLAQELMRRHKAANRALDDFVNYLRREATQP